MNGTFTEIERKFLIRDFPDHLTIANQFQVYQAYLSVDPEVRIRRNKYPDEMVLCYLAIKSNGRLKRKEVEIPIGYSQFYTLAEMVKGDFIIKDYRRYFLPFGQTLECSRVDEGKETEFMYAEVEFPDEESAQNFQPSFDYIREVTDDPAYKMKNYWKRTRLS